MADLIWLASYPKSGNTWFRSILTALLRGSNETPDINQLVGNMLVGWNGVEEAMGIKSTELTKEQILELRPAYARAWATQAETDDPVFVKTHDRLDVNSSGDPIAPPDVTRVDIYLVRNPLDVAVSYAHHSAIAPSEMVELVGRSDQEMARPKRRLGHQIPQPTGSWSDHVRSWTIDPPVPVHVIRYEDMIADPVSKVAGAVAAAKLDYDTAAIERAVEVTTFDRLTAKESDAGFREKAPNSERFFRKGKIGSWRDELTVEEAATIVESERDVMIELGYINDAGELAI